MKKHDYDAALVAEGLTAYAIERQSGFEPSQAPGRPPRGEVRRFWIDAVLQGMARLEGSTPGPEMMERFDQRLKEARGYAAVEMLPLPAQRELVRNLRNYVSALEATGEHRGLQVAAVRELFEDMAAHLPWDSSTNGLDRARDEAGSTLLRMTARKPIHFTRILLGGETGPGGEDLVPGIVTDAESVRGTGLFKRLTREHPEVDEWPAVCTVWLCGGQKVATATRPADVLELKAIREEGTRFLDRPGVSPVWPHELRVRAREQIPGQEELDSPVLWEPYML